MPMFCYVICPYKAAGNKRATRSHLNQSRDRNSGVVTQQGRDLVSMSLHTSAYIGFISKTGQNQIFSALGIWPPTVAPLSRLYANPRLTVPYMTQTPCSRPCMPLQDAAQSSGVPPSARQNGPKWILTQPPPPGTSFCDPGQRP